MASTVACDLFTVPTIAFGTLLVFVVLHHGSRRILHVGVTEHPTAEWAAQQLVEAVGEHDDVELSHLRRDRDGVYGEAFRRKVDALRLHETVTPKDRCHPSLHGDSPIERRRWRPDEGRVVGRRVLGGLHRVYSRAA